MTGRSRAALSVMCLGLAIAGVAAAGSAQAAIVGLAGAAQNPADSSCFTNSNGRVTNNCNTTRQWCVGSYISSSGTKTVKVNGRRPNGGTLTCHSKSVNASGSVQSSTGNEALSVVDSDSTFTVGNVSVPSFGSLYVCCDLSTGARINTINF